MNCSNCGNQINPEEAFCGVCGNPINNTVPNNQPGQNVTNNAYGPNVPPQPMYGPNVQQNQMGANMAYGPSVPPQPMYGPNAPIQPAYGEGVQPGQVVVVQGGSDNSRTILFITMIACIVGCFLPLISISIFGTTFSINYVYNEGRVADGIFIVGAQIVAIIFSACYKKIPVIIMQLISWGIWANLIYNLFNNFSEIASISSGMFKTSDIFSFLGIGFYLVTVSLVLALIYSFKLPKQ